MHKILSIRSIKLFKEVYFSQILILKTFFSAMVAFKNKIRINTSSKVDNLVKVQPLPSVKSRFQGRQLVFRQDEERDVYFTQLNEAW